MANTKDIQRRINEITKKIVIEFKPEKIILFGSYAWGEPNQDSDIDLFIVKKTNDPNEVAIKIDRAIFPRFFLLDLIVKTPEQIKNTKNYFIENILNKGKILYVK